MWSVAPASVMLLGLIGLLVVAFATTRMALLERRMRRAVPRERPAGAVLRSTV